MPVVTRSSSGSTKIPRVASRPKRSSSHRVNYDETRVDKELNQLLSRKRTREDFESKNHKSDDSPPPKKSKTLTHSETQPIRHSSRLALKSIEHKNMKNQDSEDESPPRRRSRRLKQMKNNYHDADLKDEEIHDKENIKRKSDDDFEIDENDIEQEEQDALSDMEGNDGDDDEDDDISSDHPVRRRSDRIKKQKQKNYNEKDLFNISMDSNGLRRSQRERKPAKSFYDEYTSNQQKKKKNIRNNANTNNETSTEEDSESSSSQKKKKKYESSYSTDEWMELRNRKRLAKDRNKIKPINLHDLGIYNEDMAPNMKKKKDGLADISPMELNLNIDWTHVGGLEAHIQKLKEMVVLPLLYPDEFGSFKMSAPKGVLFHGPPGTGKTLVARILAAQCSKYGKKVSFYMRKGADCLSKWVGEAERQLRLLFDEAYKNSPAIIFFDEIDGLAPVRSSKQDQIHSSIVSTLLALMDGLDSRGQIIVIGATNRPDAIDPALRRPGRFDRELLFNLPSKTARKDILKIHTKSWNPALSDTLLNELAELTVGYCGADLEALCREAFLISIRRTYPQIYVSNTKLKIDVNQLKILKQDFEKAVKEIVPSSQRSSLVYAKPLNNILLPLLVDQYNIIKQDLSSLTNKNKFKNHLRYLIHADNSHYGQTHLGASILHLLEEYPSYSLDLPSIYGDPNTKNAEECLVRIFKEAIRNTPSVIYWPHINEWWNTAHDSLKTSIVLMINDISKNIPILLLSTSDISIQELPPQIQSLFLNHNNFDATIHPKKRNVQLFWKQLHSFCHQTPTKKPKSIQEYGALSTCSSVPNEKEEKDENEMKEKETIKKENESIIALRSYIRSVCNRLCKHFKDFIDKIDCDGIVENDMSLFDIRERNNNRKYPTVELFLEDIDVLVNNIKNSSNGESLKARQYLNEACHLQDTALSMICQINNNLANHCQEIYKKYNKINGKKVTFVNDNDNNNDNIGISNDIKLIKPNNNDIIMEMNQDINDEDDDVKVIMDDSKLEDIISRLIKVTGKYTIDEFENKMYCLLRIVYQHSDELNKAKLLDDLSQYIKTYLKG